MYSAATTYMVAKLGTLKTQEYTQTTDRLTYRNGSSLKLNSVNAVKLEKAETINVKLWALNLR